MSVTSGDHGSPIRTSFVTCDAALDDVWDGARFAKCDHTGLTTWECEVVLPVTCEEAVPWGDSDPGEELRERALAVTATTRLRRKMIELLRSTMACDPRYAGTGR